MSQLYQMQLSFDPLEDRLQFRVNTHDKAEYRFWFTRRYVRLLWAVLLEMLKEVEAGNRYTDPRVQAAVLSFQHENMLQQMDFSKPFEANNQQYPLGDQAVLLSRISRKKRDDGSHLLCLHPKEGAGVDLVLSESMLHSLCKMLSETVKMAEWDLRLQIGQEFSSSHARSVN
ncbi:hypothetical protein [Beggiatoa leptomitoformis]|uniref:Uncharacterized protein n=1 Tax=Beggiatoa leptomitoformis TaxID=288004 RepID=A0A2N9YIS3_9GAMM|nr:hypothetical protein [Beggiatoa leptomitoformis]ALG67648.1 hypothetical protein AL038_07945 [Beggiatoa leptomitoformis]AUI70116.1 hypothetical protein BLE401_16365 [Beggiatoa leptomitoformis]